MNLTKITPYLLTSFRSDAELVKHINKISENFTIDRDQIKDYVETEKLVAAYTAFYLTTNYPKFAHIMKYIQELGNDFNECEWIDIGCGPGTFLFAIKDFYGGALKENLWGIEVSPLMRNQANKLIEGLYAFSNISVVQSASEIPIKKKKRIVLFSHSLNEMGNEKALLYLKKLDPDKILFIEPGTKEFFHQYLELRNKLIEMEFNCLYPCPNNKACPMEGINDWCHQYIKVKHEREVERLTQLSYKNRKWLPLTIGLYSKNENTSWTESMGRIVRTYPSTKFSFEWNICSEKNDKNVLEHFQVMKRGLAKSRVKELASALAGEKYKFVLDRELEDNKFRVKLMEIADES